MARLRGNDYFFIRASWLAPENINWGYKLEPDDKFTDK
jgi:hypothetical protein